MLKQKSSVQLEVIFSLMLALLWSSAASGGIHTWDVVEVFSNVDGTIQYIELQDVGVGGGETNVGNGTVGSNTQSHGIANGPVVGPTNGKFYLIATQGFADLPGAPAPDEILPSSVVPFFSTAGDTVTFSSGDSFTFGSVPTDGSLAARRIGGNGTNTPTNYAGQTGTVSAAPPAVPLSSWPTMLVMLLMMIGATLIGTRNRGGAATD